MSLTRSPHLADKVEELVKERGSVTLGCVFVDHLTIPIIAETGQVIQNVEAITIDVLGGIGREELTLTVSDVPVLSG